jgi:putative transposase
MYTLWYPFSGYNEIQNPRRRYSLIDYQRLIPLLQMKDIEDLQASCKKRVDEAIVGTNQTRVSKWTESIAVGSERFIEATKSILGIKAKGRKIIGSEKSYELREPAAFYGGNLAPENGHLSLQNSYSWADYQ